MPDTTVMIPSQPPSVEFDDFLYASIGVENVSVLSALARLNVDPWDEAARLARLPREAASRFLANLIAAQSVGSSVRADPEMEAKRLTALLPGRITPNIRSSGRASAKVTGARPWFIHYMVYYIVLTIVFFGSQWLLGRSRESARASAAAVPTTKAEVAPTVAPTSVDIAPNSK